MNSNGSSKTDEFNHIPVLLEEILSFLPKKPELVVDFTLGGGNHSYEILKKYPDTHLIGIDRDEEAINAASKKLKEFSGRVRIIHSQMSRALQQLKTEKIKADFAMADLGVSSHQIGTESRGFSFRKEGPLDMRMDTKAGPSAADVVNTYREKDLSRIIRKFGEEPFASKIAAEIVRIRSRNRLETTSQLKDCVLNAIPKKLHFGKIHPATKTFQAIRIEVNGEIEEVNQLLENSLEILNAGGRLGVLSFHSLEDRPVKQAFKRWEDPCTCPKSIPICVCGLKPRVSLLTKRAVKASADEMEQNYRSRSARLRVIEKI